MVPHDISNFSGLLDYGDQKIDLLFGSRGSVHLRPRHAGLGRVPHREEAGIHGGPGGKPGRVWLHAIMPRPLGRSQDVDPP